MKTEQTEYEAAVYTGKNASGWTPVDDYVLIRADTAVRKTRGGVELPDDLTDRQSRAAESGVVVALGDGAFIWNADRTRQWAGDKPAPGTHVTFVRYSGQLIFGEDGSEYRMMRDSCIVGFKKN